jgi:hypothetical protein
MVNRGDLCGFCVVIFGVEKLPDSETIFFDRAGDQGLARPGPGTGLIPVITQAADFFAAGVRLAP